MPVFSASTITDFPPLFPRSVGKYGALGIDQVRCLGNWFNVANTHFQHAAKQNEKCKRHRRLDNRRRLPRAEFKKEEECTCGHKVRLNNRDCEIIAASAGIARENNRETVREVRHRFRLWRRQLKLRGESDGEEDDDED